MIYLFDTDTLIFMIRIDRPTDRGDGPADRGAFGQYSSNIGDKQHRSLFPDHWPEY